MARPILWAVFTAGLIVWGGLVASVVGFDKNWTLWIAERPPILLALAGLLLAAGYPLLQG